MAFETKAAQSLDADKRDAIFGQVFGNRKAKPVRPLRLPVILDRQAIGEVAVQPYVDPAQLLFDAGDLVALLEPRLAPARLDRLGDARTPDGLIPIGALIEAGVAVRLDEATLSLVIEIPPEIRPIVDLAVRGRPPIGRNGIAAPADVSAYLNFRTGMDYVHDGPTGGRTGRQPTNVAFDSGTSILGFVLEGTFNYAEGGARRWQRGDLRIVRDDPQNSVRYVVGDLAYPVTGFQSFQALGGITIAKNFDLQPYRTVQPSGRQEILLRNDSRVDVLVNGRRDETLQLAPGRYTVRDFALRQGVNDVQLRITDNVGRTSTIDLPFFFSTELLAEGLHEYAYSLGAPSVIDGGTYSYRKQIPVLSAFHRYGISDNLTVGGNLQGDGTTQMIGAELSSASSLGVVQLDLAGSRGQGGPSGAARLTYSFTSSGSGPRYGRSPGYGDDLGGTGGPGVLGRLFSGGEYRSLTASAEFTGRGFVRLGDTTASNSGPSNPVALDLALRYSQTIARDLTVTAGLGYHVGRGGQRDSDNQSLSFRQWLSPRLSSNLDLTRTLDGTGREEYRAFVTFSLLLDEPRQFIQASADTREHQARLDWQLTPEYDVRDLTANVSVGRSKASHTVNAAVSYPDYRFETSLFHDETLPRGSGDLAVDRRTSLRFGSALVFADGHAALSRPINDSFVLVAAHPNLDGQRIGVDPTGQRYRAAVDFWGPAVVPSVASYRVRPISVIVPDLPVGLDLGQDSFQIQPTYRSGTVLTVGTDASVLGDGVLVDAAGAPIALTGGTVMPAEAGTSAQAGGATEHEFFTNRSGRFRIEGLKPGVYHLQLRDGGAAPVRVEIPAGTQGVFRLGTLVIARKEAAP